MGKKLGLSPGWSYDVIKQVGTYCEIFEAYVGDETPLKVARGLNALWTDGGLQYAMPLR
jgi:general L-amino acid transport system substrate-binding protein